MPGAKVGFVARFVELWREHPVKTTAVGVLVLIGLWHGITFAVHFLLAQKSGGDEPPIRVKGGSLYLDLMAKKGTDQWTRDADGTYIAANGKRNGAKMVLLTLPPSIDNNCDRWMWVENDEITVTFTDTASSPAKTFDVVFNVKEHGNGKDKKTTLTAGTLPLSIDNSETRHLSNTDAGYISKVKIGNNLTCSFTADDKEELILFER